MVHSLLFIHPSFLLSLLMLTRRSPCLITSSHLCIPFNRSLVKVCCLLWNVLRRCLGWLSARLRTWMAFQLNSILSFGMFWARTSFMFLTLAILLVPCLLSASGRHFVIF